MVSVPVSPKQLSLFVLAVIVTTISVLALIVGLIGHRNTEPTMLTNSLDIIAAGSWILWSHSRLRAHVDTMENEIRTDVVYAAHGNRLHKVE
jgi:hypothetical protein